MGLINKALGVYKRYGLLGFMLKLNEKIQSPMRSYGKRVREFMPTEEELHAQREFCFLVEPRISIIVPAYETKTEFLEQLIVSLEEQSYENWELCIADASSSDIVEKVVRERITKYEREKPNYCIRYLRLSKNAGISENTNEGLKLATGSYIGFMDHDDVLEKNALYEVVQCINQFPQADVIYSDEDKVSYDLKHHTQPHFKPDFNLELLRDNNHICHFLVVSRTLLEKVGGFRKEFDGSQDYDFVLRCVEQAKQVKHIPKILYHWRMHSASTAGDSDSKTYTFDAGQKALEEHFKRLGIEAEVQKRIEVGCFHIKYKDGQPYRQEDFILLLPEGVVPCGDDWREELYSDCSQKRVGIVAGKTIDTHGKIRQNGYIFDVEGNLRPAFCGLNAKYKGYCRRAVLAQEMGAVSFEFALIKKEAYDKVGGFDTSLPHPYMELDFCLRLQKAGYAVIQAPSVTAIVKKEPDFVKLSEKVVRNGKKEPVFLTENQAREQIHSFLINEGYTYDKAYNPNFSEQGKTFELK